MLVQLFIQHSGRYSIYFIDQLIWHVVGNQGISIDKTSYLIRLVQSNYLYYFYACFAILKPHPSITSKNILGDLTVKPGLLLEISPFEKRLIL